MPIPESALHKCDLGDNAVATTPINLGDPYKSGRDLWIVVCDRCATRIAQHDSDIEEEITIGFLQ